ncbi:MAG: hypothetical protein LBK06_03085 [Planctomycetaceae bacterium]|jgi:hypothetical protein|nr:hypothetical protein [Planctomycetaceae bacterium]
MLGKIYFAMLGQKKDRFGKNKATATTTDKKNKISKNAVLGVIPSFCFIVCFLAVVLFVAGCSTISRCEPCMPVDCASEQNAPSKKFNLLSNLYNKKQHHTNTNPSAKPSQKKSNAMSYLTIPPPPESPE